LGGVINMVCFDAPEVRHLGGRIFVNLVDKILQIFCIFELIQASLGGGKLGITDGSAAAMEASSTPATSLPELPTLYWIIVGSPRGPNSAPTVLPPKMLAPVGSENKRESCGNFVDALPAASAPAVQFSSAGQTVPSGKGIFIGCVGEQLVFPSDNESLRLAQNVPIEISEVPSWSRQRSWSR